MSRIICAVRFAFFLICLCCFFCVAQAAEGEELSLLELAEKKFVQFNPAEMELFENGGFVDKLERPLKGNELNNDPNEAGDWPKERVIRAEYIEWLCTDPKASTLVTHEGIDVKGVRIDGYLNLKHAKISFPLSFGVCAFSKKINLKYAEIGGLYLKGTHTQEISANYLKVNGGAFLDSGFKANGEVNLLGATIGGQLNCSNGHFINPSGYAFIADQMSVVGSVFMCDGFKANGEVRVVNATIGGQLVCLNGQFTNFDPNSYALMATGIEVDRDVFLNGRFIANGGVNLSGAMIDGEFNCKGGKFIKTGLVALHGGNMTVGKDVLLKDSFIAKGEVRLMDATIGGLLNCQDASFVNAEKLAFNAGRMKVGQSVFMDGKFRADGEVNLVGAVIGGQLNCGGDRNKRIKGGEFINPGFGKAALRANNITVERDVWLNNSFTAEGQVIFIGATINGRFILKDVISPEKIVLDLRSARIESVEIDENSYPERGNLDLHGLVFEEIFDEDKKDVEGWKRWIRSQYDPNNSMGGEGRFSPQPYEQLATVLKRSGRENDAKKVLVEKNVDKGKFGKMSFWGKFWHRFLGITLQYGYNPWRMLLPGFLIIVAGWFLFNRANIGGLMVRTQEKMYHIQNPRSNTVVEKGYADFNAFVYSIDLFVPLIDLREAGNWLPNANKTCNVPIAPWSKSNKLKLSGNFLRYWMWIHIAMGWIVCTLFVVGLTGLVRS